MAKKRQHPKKQSPKQKSVSKKRAHQSRKKKKEQKSALEKTNRHFHRKSNLFFWVAMALTIIFGILLFDIKISEGGDDSGYLLAAQRFINGEHFPIWHGSFYPIFISLPMLIIGFNVVAFKIISFLLIIGHLFFLYYAFKDRVSSTVLIFVLLITAINSHILYYASQTYSEALYLFLQSVTIYLFFVLWEKAKEEQKISRTWKYWLLFGASMFMLSTTRNVGLSMVLTVIFFFILQKKWLQSLYAFASWLIFQIPFNIYKRVAWDMKQAGFEGQFGRMFYVHPYDKSQGTEDFMGFVTRFFENSKLYLSKHFFQIIGLQSLENKETSLLLTLLVVALFTVALVWFFRRNKAMLFVSLYLGISVGATFITQQVLWDQRRLILIYVPLTLLLFGELAFDVAKQKKSLRFIYFVLVVFYSILFLTGISKTIKAAQDHNEVFIENITGNKYFGFTPDWVHYLQMTEWAAENIPDTSRIACRKPNIAFVYGNGREFFGIYRFPNLNLDTVFATINQDPKEYYFVNAEDFKKQKVPNAIVSQFRPHLEYFIDQTMGSSYYAYSFPPDEKEKYLAVLKQLKINYFQDKSKIVQDFNQSDKLRYAVDPDQLLNYFKDNEIDFVIMASIRKYPEKKTPYTVNTILRYLYYIEQKYPGTFRQILRIGNPQNEPAYIYEVVLPGEEAQMNPITQQ